jgi:hypothetical protein
MRFDRGGSISRGRRRNEKDDMEAWDAIRARRNVRQYRPEPVSEDDLNRIA